MTTSPVCRTIAALIVAMTILPASAHAQLKGHYVPGFTGLQNGSQGLAKGRDFLYVARSLMSATVFLSSQWRAGAEAKMPVN